MNETITNNKRIAKNTLVLYFRMLFMMCVSLFTSRITLDSLGITDYGVYNVIGGMVAMFTILSGAMTVAISRYITICVGKNDEKQLNIIFSTSIIIQSIMAFAIILVSEIVGIWFLDNKMVLPIDRMYAAHWVLQCSIVTFVINLISIPYNAVIIAHEKMSAFAYISIFEAIMKLLIVYALYLCPIDKLIFYAILLTILAIIMRLIYGVYCHKHFMETHFKIVFNKNILKEMFGFIGWAFIGNGVVVLKDQGTNLLLNVFCGPTVNAARGVALQVNTAVYNFVSNFLIAVTPQITKNYSSGNLTDMHKLIIRSSKYAFFIMLIILTPICTNIDYLLNLWLVEVPKHTANFVTLTLLYSLLDCFATPLITGVLAQGSIKPYEIILTFLYFFNFIFSYIVLKAGMVPEWCFILNIIFKFFVVIALLNQSHKKYNFPILLFIKQCAFPCFVTSIICYSFTQIAPITESFTFLKFVINSLLVIFVCLVTIWVLGINKKEKKYFLNFAKYKLQI